MLRILNRIFVSAAMKLRILVFILILVNLFSCKGRKNTHVFTYQLSRSDYVEKAYIPGTVQAVNSSTIGLPRVGYSLTVAELVQDGAYVRQGDTLCILSSSELESQYKDVLRTIDIREAELKKAEADNHMNIVLLEARLAESEAQQKISFLDSLKIRYATDLQKQLIELEIRKAGIEKNKIEKKLASTRKIAENDMRQKRALIAKEKTRAQMLKDQLSSLTIIAKRDGIVMRTEAPMMMIMSNRGSGTYGGPVREGTVLMSGMASLLQFPDLSRMQVSADAPEADFKRIEKGQKVFITVDAAGKLLTTGRVNRKSLAQSMAQRYSRSKVKTYEVIIDIDSCHSKIKPGLSADCEIILDEENDTIFIPSLAIFERDSSAVVYVSDKDRFIPVKVETGTAGSSYTLITSGLQGYETIALSEPPEFMIADDQKKSKK